MVPIDARPDSPLVQQAAMATSRRGERSARSRGTEKDNAGTLNAGERIDRYRLVRKLGEGGLADVYLAEQVEPAERQRHVALKVVRAEVHSSEVAKRFESEVRAIASLDHPHIAKALDTGRLRDGRPYCVMEYVPGVSITEYSDRHRLTLRGRLELFLPVCAAIQHAHDHGIIHRDIKPANVLVTMANGEPFPKIIDFGIVRLAQAPASDQPQTTLHGELLGTPGYMSPEQSDTDSREVDARSDVYSLGAMLYELLVGALPFDAAMLRDAGPDGLARMHRVASPPPMPQRIEQLGGKALDIAHQRQMTVRELRRALRDELQWIVARAMESNRARRYASARDLAADIRRYLRNEVVSVAPASIARRLRSAVRRQWRLIAAGATAAVGDRAVGETRKGGVS